MNIFNQKDKTNPRAHASSEREQEQGPPGSQDDMSEIVSE